jgi:hypothetical protein
LEFPQGYFAVLSQIIFIFLLQQMLIKRGKLLSTANGFDAMRHRAAAASTPTYDGVSLDLGSSGLSKAGQVTNIVLR